MRNFKTTLIHIVKRKPSTYNLHLQIRVNSILSKYVYPVNILYIKLLKLNLLWHFLNVLTDFGAEQVTKNH